MPQVALPRVWRILFAYARCRALVRRRSTSYLLLHESHVPPLPLSGPVRRDALVAPLLARARLKEVQLRQANRLRRARLLPPKNDAKYWYEMQQLVIRSKELTKAARSKMLTHGDGVDTE